MDTLVQRDGRRGRNAPVEVKSPQKTRALALAPQQRAESPGVEMIELQPKTRTHQQPQEERLQQQGGSARQGGRPGGVAAAQRRGGQGNRGLAQGARLRRAHHRRSSQRLTPQKVPGWKLVRN